MKVGEIFYPDDDDFRRFKTECMSDQGWAVCYDKSACRVSTRQNSLSQFDVLRIQAAFNDISSELLYDVIHDSQYRSTWDTAMLEGYEICSVSPCSDIGYYSVKSPPPFKNRDFVTQRCWLDLGQKEEKYIINHSVNHLREPPRKSCIRGISYLTGYLIVPAGSSSCTLYYMTQADPGGSLPTWFVNKLLKVLAPRLMKKLAKACTKYDTWKARNQPSYKPWLYPEQMTMARYAPNDIGKLDVSETLVASANAGEAAVAENTVEIDNIVKDD